MREEGNTRTEEDFRSVGHTIVSEFEHEGSIYVFYRQNGYDPQTYITGDKFGWQFGLKYSKLEKVVIEPYYLNESEQKAIERNYPEYR